MSQIPLNKTRILVIDDSEELLEVFKFIFEKQGYEIITKKTVTGIAAFVSNNIIDILILDVRINEIDGRHICKELKSSPLTNYFSIVLMSASPEYLVDFEECNADDFIEKPFDINKVIVKINSLVAKKTTS